MSIQKQATASLTYSRTQFIPPCPTTSGEAKGAASHLDHEKETEK